MESVAIMQPYFVPYAGYFRLFAAADLFVIYDCVQFPRRGWVHRNRLPDANGNLAWLTLPLVKASREVLIRDLRFQTDAGERLKTQLRKFPSLSGNACSAPIVEALSPTETNVVDYLERLLRQCCDMLGLGFNTVRSSSLGIHGHVRGADRIIAIARSVGAKQYINAPGGRLLYDVSMFARQGLDLMFLSDYQGSNASILHRLLTEPADLVCQELRAQTTLAR
ncbi:MAG: WbqC family protein [Pseudomonadota bacterium]